MQLPSFKYHPDPVSTGSVVRSDTVCECCGLARGWIYVGPVYAEEEYDECICPWCIADGSAHERLDASFADEAGVGGGGAWEAVPDDVVEEVAFRTPGFSGWQQERWWTHCGDAAKFLGPAGHDELDAYGPDVVDAIRESTGLPDGEDWRRFFRALQKRSPPTAYVFECTVCGARGGYQDTD